MSAMSSNDGSQQDETASNTPPPSTVDDDMLSGTENEESLEEDRTDHDDDTSSDTSPNQKLGIPKPMSLSNSAAQQPATMPSPQTAGRLEVLKLAAMKSGDSAGASEESSVAVQSSKTSVVHGQNSRRQALAEPDAIPALQKRLQNTSTSTQENSRINDERRIDEKCLPRKGEGINISAPRQITIHPIQALLNQEPCRFLVWGPQMLP